MKTKMNGLMKCVLFMALALSSIATRSVARAEENDPSFAQQQEAAMRVSRERIRQVLAQVNRLSTGSSVGFPSDYLVASQQLLNQVEGALTHLDAEIAQILMRFQEPIARYNQISSAANMDQMQRGILLREIDVQIDQLKVQASQDYNQAVRRVYDLIPGLPVLSEGSIHISSASRAQKVQYGCDSESRHIFKAVFKRVSGEEAFTGYQCVKGLDRNAAPSLSPFGAQVRAQFKEHILTPILSQNCQTESCKSFLSLDYARLLQQLSAQIDKNQEITFGSGQYVISVVLGAPQLDTAMVGSILVLSTLPAGCELSEDTRLENFFLNQNGSSVYRGNPTDDVVLRVRSRADVLVHPAAFLLQLVPVAGQLAFSLRSKLSENYQTYYDTVRRQSNNTNSYAWRAEQERLTYDRCQEKLDSSYGGDRDHYECVRYGWERSGPRQKMHRERYYVALRRVARVSLVGNDFLNAGYELLFRTQADAVQACLVRE